VVVVAIGKAHYLPRRSVWTLDLLHATPPVLNRWARRRPRPRLGDVLPTQSASQSASQEAQDKQPRCPALPGPGPHGGG
jgi:hypothetical protein